MKPSFILRFVGSKSWILVAVLIIVASLDPLPTQVQCFSSSSSRSRSRSRSSRTALIYRWSSARRKSRSTARSTTAILRMAPQSPQPLASERDWSAYFDKATGLIYYFNGKTGESLWTPPTKSFPTVDPATILSLQQQQQQEKSNNSALTDSVGFVTNVFKKIEDAGTKTFTTVKKLEEVAIVMRNYNINNNNNNSNNNQNKINSTSVSTTTTATTLSQQVQITSSSASLEQSRTTTTSTTTTTTKFTFANIFASAIPKQQLTKLKTDAQPKNKISNITNFDIATIVLPSPEKVTWGGEDATFVVDRTFGVFDGVSGATKEDGMPLYSKTLADQILKNLSSSGTMAEAATTTARGLSFSQLGRLLLLASTYANQNATGASTAILGSIGEDGVLRVINLGDSAAWVVRDGAIIARTKEISHYFDCPYQLAVDSPDRPRDCTKLQLELLPQDIVLMASDGIFDNLSESAVCKVLASLSNNMVSPSSSSSLSSPAARIAKSLVEESRRVSLDINAETPYAKLAKKNRYDNYRSGLGGKVDDISCVLVVCT